MHTVLSFVSAYPGSALLVVAVVAFAESLAIIGTVVPAAVVMFTAGALIGKGLLQLWTTLAVAVLGAALGDALSYELGRRHQARIRAWGPFQRHGAVVERSEGLLRRHGGKSVALARFTGAVRAFVPLLAGFARMPRLRFYCVNVISAALWAPAHILPGVLFGTSLALAEAVSGRIAAILLLLVALIWAVSWLASLVVRFGVPRVRVLRDALVQRARGADSPIARATLALLDPRQPGSHALLLGSVVLLGAGWLFLGVLEDVLSHDPLVTADVSVFQFLQALRSAPVDRLMVAVTQLGSAGVLVSLIVSALGWLAWRRCWRTAGYVLAVLAFGELLVQVLKVTLSRPRPLANIYAGTEQFSFPSGHVTVSTVVLAFLAFLLARGRGWRVRIGIAVATGLYVALVAFSRLYLGAHWLSDVLGGMSIGLSWVAFAAMVYTRRGIDEDIGSRALTPIIVAAIVVFGSVWIRWRSAGDLLRFAVSNHPQSMSQDDWAGGGWRSLPSRRLEAAGEPQEAFHLQWACPLATVTRELEASGWQAAPAWSYAAAVRLLEPAEPIQDVPVLPRFNLGQRSRLAFIRWSPQRPHERDVLRLWLSEFELPAAGGAIPIWYGATYREIRGDHRYLPRNVLRQVALPLQQVLAMVPGASHATVKTQNNGESVALLRCVDG